MNGNVCLGIPAYYMSARTKVRIIMYAAIAALVGAMFLIGRV